ncbi:MAG: three component ABC system middle component [Pirellulaceae bacterium]
MTTPLTKEVRYVQNPALGAVLLWRFSVGFTESHTTSDSPVLPLSFLVLPILMHHETFDFLRSTQKQTGLHGFADKFSRTAVSRSDLLLAIHTRAEAMKALTIESLQAGVRHSLITLTSRDAKLLPLSTTKPSGIAASLKPMIDGAEKLGVWFSQMTPFEVFTTLKVAL